VKEVLSYLKDNPEIIDYYSYSILPDEMIFQTVIMHLKQGEKHVNLKPQVTYTDFSRPDVPLPVTFDKQDFDLLVNLPENFLFARKFDVSIDEKILDRLDNHLQQPKITAFDTYK
jgi:hypothetical protein